MSMTLSSARRVYIVGIKGTGMTTLAQVLQGNGKHVEGSDTAETFFTDEVLRRSGILVHEGFSSSNLPEKIDLVLYSTAYAKDHPEIQEAHKRGLPLITYPEALGELFQAYEGISIAGSHGKTTTTAMIGLVLRDAGRDPTVLVGASIPAFGGNAIVGRSTLLVVETDEYQNKFTWYAPRHLVVTNIDYDHPDFFPSAASYRDAFAAFITKLSHDGILVTNAHDQETVGILHDLGRSGVTFGFGSGDVAVTEAAWRDGRNIVRLVWQEREYALRLIVPGRHNAENAAAAFAFCVSFGIEPRMVIASLEAFSGTARRFQFVGGFRGAQIVDDFAHHPTEIAAAIAAARDRFPDRRLITVFHPHTYSRTKTFLKEFADALTGDANVVLEVFGSAREVARDVSSTDLVALMQNGLNHYAVTLDDAERLLRDMVRPSDVILLLGAGEAWKLAERLAST